MKTLLVILFFMLTAGLVNAQDVLKGSVHEVGSNDKMPDVFVRDINNKQATLTDKGGNFEIKTANGHTLIFDSPGYISDTLYVIDMKPKKVEMKSMSIALREVNINTTKHEAFNPQQEYPEVYEKSKIYLMSPSTWFSKEGKNARRLKKYFATEAQQRHIDEVYTKSYVSSIVPLKGADLENFMTLYRPTYAYLRDNNGPSLVAFINDSYKKYIALPPEKKKLVSLTGPR